MKSVLKVVASVAFLSGVSVAANAVVFDDFTDFLVILVRIPPLVSLL